LGNDNPEAPVSTNASSNFHGSHLVGWEQALLASFDIKKVFDFRFYQVFAHNSGLHDGLRGLEKRGD
jgi:hypothetical protein